MPKIPRFSGSQRFNPPSGGQAVDVGQAQSFGKSLQGLGQSVAQFGNALDNYNAVKKNTDDRILGNSFSTRAALLAQDLEKNILTSPELAPDGSNLASLFDEGMQPLIQEAQSITDIRKREVALNAISSPLVKTRGSLKDKEVILHNKHMFTKAEESANNMSQIILNDPFSYAETRAEYENFINQLPVTPDNREKMLKAGKDLAVASVIQSFKEQGNFAAAKEALNTSLAQDLNTEERAKILGDIIKEEKEYTAEFLREEDRNFKAMKRQQELGRANAMSELFTLASEDDPVKREVALKKARALVASGVLEARDLNAIEVQDREVERGVSDEIHFQFSERLNNKKSMTSFLTDVSTAVREKTLTPSAVRQLIAEYNRMGRSELGTNRGASVYSERKKAADSILQAAFPSDIYTRTSPSEQKKMLQKRSDALALAQKYREGGMQPESAMRKAIKEIDPSNIAAKSFEERRMSYQELPQLRKEAADLVQKVQSKKISEKEKERLKSLMSTIERRQKAVEIGDDE